MSANTAERCAKSAFDIILAMMLASLAVASAAITNLIVQSVDARIREADPAVALARFEAYPSGAGFGRFKPNPKFWAKEIDFSCASPWNSQGGRVRAGTLVSKRHIVFATHFPIDKGTRIVFVGQDGEVCPCWIEAVEHLEQSDISVGLLNADVTPNVHPAKIMPDNFEQYIGSGEGLPIVTLDQFERAIVNDSAKIAKELPDKEPIFTLAGKGKMPTDPQRLKFQRKMVVGDSGSPAFMIVGKEPILLFCLKFGGCGGGPAIHRRREDIQKAMNNLCPGYKLEEFDFSRLIERN